MLVVGLTGGIASGKSVVTKIFKELGALVIDADEVSREVMAPHTECWQQVVVHFGDEYVRDDLCIDRTKLAERVFSNAQERDHLNRIVHPFILKRIEEKLEVIRREYPRAMVIVDAALLVETGMYTRYDKLTVVQVSEETQLSRLMARDGLSRGEALQRINSQMPLKEKMKLADFVIENEGPLSSTREKVEYIFNYVSSLPAPLSGRE